MNLVFRSPNIDIGSSRKTSRTQIVVSIFFSIIPIDPYITPISPQTLGLQEAAAPAAVASAAASAAAILGLYWGYIRVL